MARRNKRVERRYNGSSVLIDTAKSFVYSDSGNMGVLAGARPAT